MVPLSEVIVGDIRPILLVLLGGAGLLLLIACVNVSSLLLVRAERRRREIAVRGALGASRARLSRQFVTEGLTLVAAGSAVGLGFAYGGMKVLSGLISKDMMIGMPYLRGLGLSPHVLLFTGCLAALAAILFAITPILHFRFSKMRDGLMEAGRGSAGTLWRRVGANLVVIELATAVILADWRWPAQQESLQAPASRYGVPPTGHLATISVGLPDAAFSKDEQVVAFARSVVARVQSLPGVEWAAITSVLPVSCNCNTDWVRFVGRPYNGIHNEVNERDVSAGFFATIHAKLLRGRYFTDAEDEQSLQFVVVNEAFAKKYFPGEDPVGKRMADTELTPKSIREIVGVVADFKDAGLAQEQWPAEYFHFNQNTDTYFFMMVRTRQDEQTVLPVLAAAIHQVSLQAAVEEGSTITPGAHQRLTGSVLASLGGISGGGIRGVGAGAGCGGALWSNCILGEPANAGDWRAHGAGCTRSSVYKLVMLQAGWLTGAGLAIGLIFSVGASLLIRNLLFGVQAWDAVTLGCVTLLLGLASMAASFLPARRAASVNPTMRFGQSNSLTFFRFIPGGIAESLREHSSTPKRPSTLEPSGRVHGLLGSDLLDERTACWKLTSNIHRMN